mgnify:FL=1
MALEGERDRVVATEPVLLVLLLVLVVVVLGTSLADRTAVCSLAGLLLLLLLVVVLEGAATVVVVAVVTAADAAGDCAGDDASAGIADGTRVVRMTTGDIRADGSVPLRYGPAYESNDAALLANTRKHSITRALSRFW